MARRAVPLLACGLVLLVVTAGVSNAAGSGGPSAAVAALATRAAVVAAAAPAPDSGGAFLRTALRWLGYLLVVPSGLILGWFALALRPDVPLAKLRSRLSLPHSQFVEVDGVPVHYCVDGARDASNAPTLLLLHGTVSGMLVWDRLVEALGDSVRIVRLDLPGWGLTPHPASGDYTHRWYAGFLTRFMDALQLPRATVVGSSLGGETAWSMALAHPERVERLVLVDSTGYPLEKLPTFVWFTASRLYPLFFRYASPRFLVQSNLLECYADRRQVTPELVERYHAYTVGAGMRDTMRQMNLQQSDDYKLIPTIRTPTLIQWGARDQWFPIDAVGRRFHAEIPGSVLRIYPTAGHLPQEEAPAEAAADLKAFVTGRLDGEAKRAV